MDQDNLPVAKQLPYESVADLLLKLSETVREIELEAYIAQVSDQDTDAYHALLREKAGEIINLPSALARYRTQGGEVPEELQDQAIRLSHETKSKLRAKRFLGLWVLLSVPGNSEDRPNLLEQWAEQYRPDPFPAPPAA